MEGTRLRIVALLQGAGQTTVGELAKALDMAPASIRRHLDILQRDRLVRYQAIRRKPGRPEHAFSLTEEGQEALPKRYQQLLQRLFGALASQVEVAGDAQGQGARALLAHIAHQIAEPHLPQLQGRSPQDRAATLRAILEEEEFAPSMEQLPQGLRVHLLNCPFRGVAIDNAAVCAMDQELISLILGAPAAAQQRINRDHHHCIYDIPLSG